MKRSQLLLVSTLMSTGFFNAKTAIAQKDNWEKPVPQVVAYCELIGHQKEYDHRVVQTTAIFTRGAEIARFFHPSCGLPEQSSWVDYSDELSRASPPEMIEKMETLLRSDHKVRLTAWVEFDGPKSVEVPPGTPPKLADLMRRINSRYGHLNQFNSRVLLLKVISVDPVPIEGQQD